MSDPDTEARLTQIAVGNALQRVAREVERELFDVTGEKIGFALLVFTPGRTQYISNCPRREVVPVAKQYVEYLESTTDQDNVRPENIQ